MALLPLQLAPARFRLRAAFADRRQLLGGGFRKDVGRFVLGDQGLGFGRAPDVDHGGVVPVDQGPGAAGKAAGGEGLLDGVPAVARRVDQGEAVRRVAVADQRVADSVIVEHLGP